MAFCGRRTTALIRDNVIAPAWIKGRSPPTATATGPGSSGRRWCRTDAEYLMQTAMPSKSWLCALFALACIGISSASAANDGCPPSAVEIATDRPDVTNSSLVVPTGSLQNENGLTLTSRDGATILDVLTAGFG